MMYMESSLHIKRTAYGWVGSFSAMASPCEVLVECDVNDAQLESTVATMLQQVMNEAKRIEHKFSRYRTDNLVYKINHSDGQPQKVDEETARLLDFAFQCYELSDGLFDITSGVLREVWTFDGSDRVPSEQDVSAILPRVGLEKTQWDGTFFTLPKGMEVDFGGMGKEYAVDKCLQLASSFGPWPVLVNFGGDLACNGPRANDLAWQVGIESVGGGDPARLTLKRGAMATSGDARRFLVKEGVRYSHILNPKTGQSLVGAPRSVTVAAPSCIQAGMMSTLALLQGAEAEAFLQVQAIPYWLQP